MEKDISSLIQFWKSEISDHLSNYEPIQFPEPLLQIASLFSPGDFYYYLLNFQNLQMDHVSKGTWEVLKVSPEDFQVPTIPSMLAPEELKLMQQKETVVADFIFNFLQPNEILDYKVVYFLPITDQEGTPKTLLHQVTTLKVADSGKIEHVMGVHTDVTHLNLIKNDQLSFIHLEGGKSYFNLDPTQEKFNPADGERNRPNLSTLLSKREKEIIKEMSTGKNAQAIADQLNISFDTVRTHRQNLLEKTNSSNTTEMVANCLIEGVI